MTEHLFRFTQAGTSSAGSGMTDPGRPPHREWPPTGITTPAWTSTAYVEVVEAVKAAGLPVVCGLEVDYYEGRMDEVAALLAGYPFDVLLGSVHWLGAWRFDVLDDPLAMAEWEVRDIDAVWDAYTRAMEELGASRRLRRVRPSRPREGGRPACPPCPTSATTGSPKRRPPRAWPPSCRRPAGASR